MIDPNDDRTQNGERTMNTSFKPSEFDKQAAASLDMLDEEAARKRVEAILHPEAGPTLTPAPQTQAPAPRKTRSDKGIHKPKAPADPDEVVLRLELKEARYLALVLDDEHYAIAAKIQDQIIAQLQRRLDQLQKGKS